MNLQVKMSTPSEYNVQIGNNSNTGHNVQIGESEMAFEVKINPNPESKNVAKMSTTAGFLQPTAPLTVRNQLREYQINSIQDLPDVDEVNVESGSTLVFNANTNQYEVKTMDMDDIDGAIDGGEF